MLLCLVLGGCTPQGDPGIGTGFSDDFERAQLGNAYNVTGGNWRIESGELHVQGAKNHPLWLLKTLPRDVWVELDVRSESPEGDIKVEIFGDGASFAKRDSYTATSYVIILGGWNNSRKLIFTKTFAEKNDVIALQIVSDSRIAVPAGIVAAKRNGNGAHSSVVVD